MKLVRKDLRILLVDDDENDAELVRGALIQAGFTYPLTHLTNGGMAWAYFKYTNATGALAPHLVLLDIKMPLIDGVHALRRLRKESYFHDLPVIVLTGTDAPAKRRELAKLGILRFLKKLPNCANVISALDDFIGLYNNEAVSFATPRDFALHESG